MIDREQFNRAWRILCKRLRRDLDAEAAADYRAWLSERMPMWHAVGRKSQEGKSQEGRKGHADRKGQDVSRGDE